MDQNSHSKQSSSLIRQNLFFICAPQLGGYVEADFTTSPFQVITVPDSDSFTITMAANAGATVSASGSEL